VTSRIQKAKAAIMEYAIRSSKRKEEEGKTGFTGMLFDFDKTIVETDKFYEECWRRVFTELGLSAEWRKMVYKFDGSLTNSVKAMIGRIIEGVNIKGDDISVITEEISKKIFNPVWLGQKEVEMYGAKLEGDPEVRAARVLADYKESIGKRMITEEPERAKELAPLVDGIQDFVKMIPPGVLVGIASSGRVESTISPFIKLYNLDAVFKDRLFGEESMREAEEQISGFVYKPDMGFFVHAIYLLGRSGGRIIPFDKGLYIADNGKTDYPVGIAGLDRSMSVLLVNTDPARLQTSGERWVASTGSFASLLNGIRSDNQKGEISGDNVTIAQFLQTFSMN